MFSAAKTSGPSGYNINNSLRFRASASAYLSRTPASAGNRQIMTYSFWVKRGAITGDYNLTNATTDASNSATLYFNSSNNQTFDVFLRVGATNYSVTTSQVFRDPSAWYHIVVAIDTTQATSSNRTKVYVNGSQVTNFLTANYVPQNSNLALNNNVAQYIGFSSYFDGYMAEVNFIDGQALTPSSFGSTNATTGVWQPAAYTGTYGTNGFYLKFSDIATTSGSNAGLGKDFSGNSNYWTTNNISVTAGTTYDAMTDSPTLTSATVANYANINPLSGSTIGTIDNANLRLYYNGANWSRQISTIGMTTGKYYAEFTISQIGDNSWQAGVASFVPTRSSVNQNGETSGSSFLNAYQSAQSGAVIWNNSTRYNLSVVYSAGDVIGVAFDVDTATVKYYRNGSQVGNSGGYVPNTIDSTWYFQCFSKATDGTGSYGIVDANFGQRPFSYTPPTGYVALNTYNLPTSTIVKGNSYMDATLYTGDGASTQVIVNQAQFKPDLVWGQARSAAYGSWLFDSVRGATKQISSFSTNAESTQSTMLTAFNSNGFNMGSDTAGNQSSITYVGWQWQAGQGTTSSNTQGSITSTVSVNTTAGFSVVTWTSNGVTGATIGHGLGVAPKFMIIKSRSNAGAWPVYSASIGNTGCLFLNTTDSTYTSANFFNNTTPSSTVFTTGASSFGWTNGTTWVAYCWAEIAGFSKFGSYTGNGSADGVFVYTGFRPKFIMIKCSSAIGSWYMIDTSRATYNVVNPYLLANASNAEATDLSWDILSNGFKLRSTYTQINGSGATMIYMAFAENPFKNALAR